MFVVGQAVVDCAVGNRMKPPVKKVLLRTGTNLFTWLSQVVMFWAQCTHMTPSANTAVKHLKYVLAIVAKTEVCSLVEEHADALVRELVAKAIFVWVVHPFRHPQEGLWPGQAGWVSGGWRDKDKNDYSNYGTISREQTEHDEIVTWIKARLYKC